MTQDETLDMIENLITAATVLVRAGKLEDTVAILQEIERLTDQLPRKKEYLQ